MIILESTCTHLAIEVVGRVWERIVGVWSAMVLGWWYCLMVVAKCWSGVAVKLYTMSDL